MENKISDEQIGLEKIEEEIDKNSTPEFIPLDIKELTKKNNLGNNNKITLLCCMIGILLIYIIGMNYINIARLDSETTDISTQDATDSTILSDETTASLIMVNINTDNIAELCQLSGIGESKAKAIIEYRKENGNFQYKEEVMKVKGIGENIYNKIKDNIYLE